MNGAPSITAQLGDGGFIGDSSVWLSDSIAYTLGCLRTSLQPIDVPHDALNAGELELVWQFPVELPLTVSRAALPGFIARLEADAALLIEHFRRFDALIEDAAPELRAWTHEFGRCITPLPRGSGRALYFALARLAIHVPTSGLWIEISSPALEGPAIADLA